MGHCPEGLAVESGFMVIKESKKSLNVVVLIL
jgi:hypothetical protein